MPLLPSDNKVYIVDYKTIISLIIYIVKSFFVDYSTCF
nr:MAG TPA: hypothetical protein [Caudoviricetes sp.]